MRVITYDLQLKSQKIITDKADMFLLIIGLCSFISLNYSYAESPLSTVVDILDKPEDIIPQIQHTCGIDTKNIDTDPCLSIKPLIKSRQNIIDLIFKKRAEHSKLLDSIPLEKRFLPSTITEKVDKELTDLHYQKSILNRKLKNLTTQCSNNKFKACYPKLSESVPLEPLNKLFKELTKDYRLRYNSGGGACHTRADALAFILAEKGIEAKILRIHNAPTLIAIDRDVDNNLTNRYYDYGGNHTLIQIMVKNKKGETEPYLLDPQFMAKPLKRKEYFLKTIGQNCNRVESVSSNTDLLSCSYSLMPQNSSTKNAYDLLDQSKFSLCGWAKDQDGEGLAKLRKNTIEEASENMILMNPNHTISLIKTNKNDSELTPKLIINSYVNYEKELRRSIRDLDYQIFKDYKEKEVRVKEYQDALDKLPAKINQIKKNLKFN